MSENESTVSHQFDRKVDLVVFGSLSKKGMSGLSLFHYRIASALFERGLLGRLYCLKMDDDVVFKGIKVYALWDNLFLKIVSKFYDFISSLSKRLSYRLLSERLFDFVVKQLMSECAPVVLFTKPVSPGIVTSLQKRGVKTLVVATVAHPIFIKEMIQILEKRYEINDHSSYTNNKRIPRLLQVFDRIDYIIPRIPSDFINSTYLSNGIPAEKLLNFGVDRRIDSELFKPDESKKPEEQLVFLTSGFMNLKKGLPLLLEAWQECMPLMMNCKLVVVGKLDTSTKKAVSRFGNMSSVYFAGHQKKIYHFYQSAHIFIAASVSDLGPRTIQEALSCGLPVIASSHCGMADFVVHGVNGLIYDPFNLEDLKRHILFFYENQERIQTMGLEARNSCRVNEISNFIPKLVNKCEELIPGS